MQLEFSADNEARLGRLLAEYPDRQACLLPALYIAQEQFGYLTHEVMELVAERIGMPPGEVLSTATFYTMFRKRPTGKYHIQVCGNVSCFLRGSDRLMTALSKTLGIGDGETTEDGLFTLSAVQCLAACGTAPALQVNDTYYEEMTPEKVVELVGRLREEAK
ncbi:MAG: NAD(P)H-dependent oxidoreductase subunit E [Deltaproteobacteria bacterium]|nr:NAD(P)H-dependent oxidoreductase subunit E [Deltaproteobacteria bacterium]